MSLKIKHFNPFNQQKHKHHLLVSIIKTSFEKCWIISHLMKAKKPQYFILHFPSKPSKIYCTKTTEGKGQVLDLVISLWSCSVNTAHCPIHEDWIPYRVSKELCCKNRPYPSNISSKANTAQSTWLKINRFKIPWSSVSPFLGWKI